ncbi:hypothetical protein OK016_25505 [Vibrio chagasii]|nr:hypothetical protein [Vibrio chagasii]
MDGVECVGEGCVSCRSTVEGVYQFKVKNKLPYKIVSKNQPVCYSELVASEQLKL